MGIAGGTAPAIIQISNKTSDSFVQQGFLYPLDEFIKEIPPSELDDYIVPALRVVVERIGPDHQKHLWAVPFQTSLNGLYYRKDLFAEAGLDPEHPPETWAELLEYARKIANPERGVYGFGVMGGPESSHNFCSFLFGAGGTILDQDEKGEWRAAFDTPEAADAVYFFTQLIQQKYEKNGKTINGVAVRDPNLFDLIGGNKVAMWQDSLAFQSVANINTEHTSIAPMPKGPNGFKGSLVTSSAMGIFAGVKDPHVRNAAWKFIKFWTGP
jgi:ABC-type glycerol-3-phosphate transport system substrate-binding protein